MPHAPIEIAVRDRRAPAFSGRNPSDLAMFLPHGSAETLNRRTITLMTRKKRRFSAVATQHPLMPTLRLIMMVLLPLWIAYFFAVTLFEKSLNTVLVPPLNVPLGNMMVVPGLLLAFIVTLALLGRAMAQRAPR
jgi:hypothetical protein